MAVVSVGVMTVRPQSGSAGHSLVPTSRPFLRHIRSRPRTLMHRTRPMPLHLPRGHSRPAPAGAQSSELYNRPLDEPCGPCGDPLTVVRQGHAKGILTASTSIYLYIDL